MGMCQFAVDKLKNKGNFVMRQGRLLVPPRKISLCRAGKCFAVASGNKGIMAPPAFVHISLSLGALNARAQRRMT